MSDIWVNANLGMGDAIILAGLVRTLAQKYTVHFPSYVHNLGSVGHLFKHENVVVHPVRSHQEAVHMGSIYPEILLLGFEGPDFDRIHFDRSFYKQAGFPFSFSWDEFKCPDPVRVAPIPQKPFKFVHDDASRGFKIEVEGYRPRKEDDYTIFDYVPLIKEAQEIHCIDSCFALLIDRIETSGKKFLHRSSRPGADQPTYLKEWTIL